MEKGGGDIFRVKNKFPRFCRTFLVKILMKKSEKVAKKQKIKKIQKTTKNFQKVSNKKALKYKKKIISRKNYQKLQKKLTKIPKISEFSHKKRILVFKPPQMLFFPHKMSLSACFLSLHPSHIHTLTHGIDEMAEK